MTATAPAPSAATPTTLKTVPGLIRERAERDPARTAMREKHLGIWRDISWGAYQEHVELVAHGIAALGVERGEVVGIHSENRPEWLYCDVGTVARGAITMGLYPTNPAAEVSYLLQDSQAKVLFAEDQEQVDKALEIEGELDELTHIIYFEARGVSHYDHPKLMSWEEFLEIGRTHREANPRMLDEVADAVQPDDIITLIYTSGTTGPPKGAMLTHGNVDFARREVVEKPYLADPPVNENDITLSYLPLCHVAERTFTTWFHAAGGNLVHFAESIETVQRDLAEVQPTIFLAVPRIWEKLHAGVQIKMNSASRLKRAVYAFGMKLADQIADELIAHDGNHTAKSRALMAIGHPLLFRTLRDRLGLRECRAAVSGAAPISPDVLKFFMSIGVPIYEIYGMTENTAVATINRPGRVKLGTVGEPYDGIEVKLDEQTGEILTRHPSNFAGYWRLPDKTAETLDEDGWLHTGDVGEWVDGTHLKIVDRIKDIIITAGGKNISPSEIENSIKTSPFVKEAVVIGDKKPYLVALIGIEMDTVGDWATRNQIPYTTYRDLSEKPEVLELVQGVIAETNDKFARVENVRKFRMIPKELDHEDGELTATQKVKRSTMHDMFSDLIDDMYGNGTAHAGGDQKDVHTGTKADA